MTAKEWLSQVRLQSANLNSLKDRLARYRDLATQRTAHYRSGPGGQRRVSSVEEYACKIAHLERETMDGRDVEALLGVERKEGADAPA